MNVARLLNDSVDWLTLRQPTKPISTAIVVINIAVFNQSMPSTDPKIAVTTTKSSVSVIQYDFLVVMPGVSDSTLRLAFSVCLGLIFDGLGMKSMLQNQPLCIPALT
jgi:hypothetical protein